MLELHDLPDNWRAAIESFREDLESAQREWSAKLLRSYPERERLAGVAAALREDLGSDYVEVNEIGQGEQITLAKNPGHAGVIPVEDSLCVFSVGLGKPASVSDIRQDPFLLGHDVVGGVIRSWASAPVSIQGGFGGTVCALQVDGPRVWGDVEQARLEEAAHEVADLVEAWLKTVLISEL